MCMIDFKENRIDNFTRWSLLGFTVFFGALFSWASRFLMSGDILSYFEIADAAAKHDWPMVVNGQWSPLYPLILSFFLSILHPDAFWEYAVLHLTDFIVYAAALICFDLFLREFILHTEKQSEPEGKINHWVWYVIAYPIFMVTSIFWILIRYSGADMCVAGFLYLITWRILRIFRLGWNLRRAIILGVAFALAYLSKLVMASISIIFLAILIFQMRKDLKKLPYLVLTVLIAVAVAFPWVSALSKSKNKITLGEASHLMLALTMNDLTLPNHDDRESVDPKMLKHGPRKISENPDIYEFGTPLRATYPIWYDASYWLDGIQAHFVPTRLFQTGLMWTVYNIQLIFAKDYPGMVLLVLLFYLIQSEGFSGLRRFIAPHLFVTWFPGFVMFGMYSLIHSSGRYLGGAATLIWIAAWGAVRFSREKAERKLVQALALGILIGSLMQSGFQFIKESRTVQERIGKSACWVIAKGVGQIAEQSAANQKNPYWIIAGFLKQMGVKEGDAIAAVGDPYPISFWARTGRFKMVAHVPVRSMDLFCHSDISQTPTLLEPLRKIGVKAVVTKDAKCASGNLGWKPVGESDYYAVIL